MKFHLLLGIEFSYVLVFVLLVAMFKCLTEECLLFVTSVEPEINVSSYADNFLSEFFYVFPVGCVMCLVVWSVDRSS